MTNEEREIITRFIGRVGGATQAGGFGGAPGTPAPLPPVDKEADDLIGQLLTQYPEARYRITQMAFVQEAALAEAQNRMRRMQWELDQAHQQAAQGQQQHRGFFGGLFGGGGAAPGGGQGGGPAPGTAPAQQQQQQQYAPPPPPQYAAPQYQPGMFQRSGSGFLGSALTTAAGVAGGLVVGNALMDLFSGNRGGFGGGGFGGAPGSENVVNNFYGDQSGGADPWGAGGAPPVDPGAGAGGADPWGAGGTTPDPAQADPGQADPGWGNAGTAGNAGTSGTGGAGGTTGGGGGWDDTTNT